MYTPSRLIRCQDCQDAIAHGRDLDTASLACPYCGSRLYPPVVPTYMSDYNKLYSEIEAFVRAQNWNGLNSWLISNAAPSAVRGDVVELITLLTLTLPVKSKLLHRASVYKAASDILGDRADKVLKGLE